MATIEENKAYEEELKKFQDDPVHYTTPGARRYYNRVVRGYIILAVAMVVGVYSLSNVLSDKVRHDINAYIVASCINSIPTLERFNAKLDTDIEVQQAAKKLNLEQGLTERAALNDKAINAARNSKFPVPTVKECKTRGKF